MGSTATFGYLAGMSSVRKPLLQLLVVTGGINDGRKPTLDQLERAIVDRLDQGGEAVEFETLPLEARESAGAKHDSEPRTKSYLLILEDEFGMSAQAWQLRINAILSTRRPSAILFLVDWNPERSPLGFIRVYLRGVDTPMHFVRMNRASPALQPSIAMAGAELADFILLDQVARVVAPQVPTPRPVPSPPTLAPDLDALMELRGQATVDRVGVPRAQWTRGHTGGSGGVEPSFEQREDWEEEEFEEIKEAPRKATARELEHRLEEAMPQLKRTSPAEDIDYGVPSLGGRASHDLGASEAYVRRTIRSRRRLKIAAWLLSAAAAGLLAVMFRRELAHLVAPLMKLFGAATPPSTFLPSSLTDGGKADPVELSAFGPPSCAAGEQILIQTVLHVPADQAQAFGLVTAADPTAALKVKTLSIPLHAGDKVDVLLEADGCAVDPPVQTAVWQGAPLLLQFFVTVPRDRTAPVLIKVRLAQSAVPCAQIAFRIPVGMARATTIPARLLGEDAKVFGRAFLSYSTADRVKVLEAAQLLSLVNFEYFLDMYSLKPGERRWEQRIFDEIEQADFFFLFWSNASSKSKWVVAEAEYALR
jgi:hypothetical protein